ncbi:hypothetical protein G1C96_0700 [Bifidobacterium sp. DSM 109958]|uniref:Uncharacterized protein n=1 Tax=Bifidobacterium moraviense TaxID=2675323 RepID=A0A7Y0F167_9BIFI|nr:hypothetical protein [Bifidobacterium sp. DSM 109958]
MEKPRPFDGPHLDRRSGRTAYRFPSATESFSMSAQCTFT